MKQLRLGAVLLAGTAALAFGLEDPATQTQQVDFQAQVPGVGSARSVVTSEDVSFELTIKMGEMEQNAGTNQLVATMKWTEKVLAGDDQGPNKLEVAYGECASELKGAQGSMEMPVAVEGKTYVVTQEGEATKVTSTEGTETVGIEAEQVQKDVRPALGAAPLAAVLTGRSIQVGAGST